MTPTSFWTYKSATPTPTMAEAIAAGAIPADTTQAAWETLSPGFRREIVRGCKPKESK